MKKIFTLFALAVALFAATPSQAQVSFGLKGGLNVTDMNISSDVSNIVSDAVSNKAGFFIGPTVKFTLPIVGLGVDAAALYDQRDAELNDETVSQKSINVPINLRYSIGLGSVAGVYLAAGPQFGLNIGDKSFKWNQTSSYKLKDTNFSINVGAGVQLLSHLEVGITYNIACGKTGEVNVADAASDALGQVAGEVLGTSNSRTNAWQVSAAYYF